MIIPNNDFTYRLIPNNDLTYVTIQNNDLTYRLIPNNDLVKGIIPNNDLINTFIPNFNLEYLVIPSNDVNYRLIPNSDLTYTLIPNNDLTYNVLTQTIDLELIASYLRNYMSDFRNPDFYNYTLDGDGYYISDGNGDMYDGGNATTPWLLSNVTYTGDTEYTSIQDFPYAIDYQNTGTTSVDTSFRYISLGYESPNLLPLTVLGKRTSSGTSIGFQCGGNIGADGEGTHVEGNIYAGDTVSGYTVHSYYSQTYAAGDPSVCDVFILLGHPNWNSVFGDVFYGGDSSTNGSGSFLYTTGNGVSNILAIKTLLSKQFDAEVTFSEVKTVVDNFILRINESQNSSSTPTPTPTPTSTPTSTPIGEFYITNCGISHTYESAPGVPWNSYGGNYLQVGPSQEGGGIVPPQAGWYFVDDLGTVRQLLNDTLWFSNGNPSPYTNGNGWLCVANGSFEIFSGTTTLTFCESQPTVIFGSTPTPTPTPTETPTPTPTETPTPVSHPYEHQIIDRTDVTGQFGSDLSLACQALDCLTNSTCTVAGYSNGYFNNEIPQIGDSSYNGITSTVITGLVDGYYIINLGVQYILVEFVSNHINSVPSCPTPTPTPTPTSTPTPTPTPTESPLDFTISSDCINGGAVYSNNHIGGSGVYDRGTGLYDTESEALNETGWFQIMSPSHYVSNGAPYFNTTRTYWVALRDRNNQSNIVVKSILVDCGSTPTPTPTSTPTPTPTSTPTPTVQPSGLIVTISEVGSDVIMSGSGSLNLTGLSEGSVQSGWGINGTLGTWVIGPSASFFGRKYFGNVLTTYPNSFGSGYTSPTSFSGDAFGVQVGSINRDIVVPIGYTSGSPLSGTATFANKTITSMGLTPGTYVYSWGTDSITLQIGS